MRFRQALPTFLKAQSSLSAIGGRVFPVIRQQDTTTPALVFRVTNGDDGQVVRGDSGERVYTAEIVVWHTDYLAADAIGDALKALFHGTTFTMGDISIKEAWKINEYDGDRVTDSYSDAGDYAITYVFEFRWVKS